MKKVFIILSVILVLVISANVYLNFIYKTDITANVSNIDINYSIKYNEVKAELGNNTISASVPIFMYHWIKDDTGDYAYPENMVKIDELKRQMTYLKENNYDVLFVSDLDNIQHYNKPVILTFDDGWQDVYNIAFPYAKELNMKFNMYIITDLIGTPGYCTLEQLAEMRDSGLVELDSHTLSHPYLAQLSREQVEKELVESKRFLKDNLNVESTVICYPSGSQNLTVQQIAKENYKYGLLMDGGVFNYNSEKSNMYAIERIYCRRSMSLDVYKNYCEQAYVKINE